GVGSRGCRLPGGDRGGGFAPRPRRRRGSEARRACGGRRTLRPRCDRSRARSGGCRLPGGVRAGPGRQSPSGGPGARRRGAAMAGGLAEGAPHALSGAPTGRRLRWEDGVVLSLTMPAALIAMLGYSIGSLGTWDAVALWGVSMLIATAANWIYTELAAMFP